MCGIAGIISDTIARQDLRTRVESMNARLAHRGPNDEGLFIDQGIAFGHRRLSILDLTSAGHQPMTSASGRYTIVFNGEIYNFADLRQELAADGVQFRSRSDTEVILALYEREGDAAVNVLDGMFAFAIWDNLERRCFLARGPFGIKPLYIWRYRETLAFASELQALLQAKIGRISLCRLALQEYFLYGSVQEPRTLVDEIEVLPAGYSLTWQHGGGRRQKYWQLQFASQEISPPDAVSLTRTALDDSIRRHFVSDVPVGIFLSGGIDSTAIVALARANGFENLKTVCISFDEQEFNEGALAAETAAHFRTEHHDWRLTATEGRELIDDFLDHNDQPSNDGFNTFCVSKAAHELGLKVVLSGLGGDELFGGYRSFQLIPKLQRWHQILSLGGPFRRVAGRLSQRIGRSNRFQRFGNYLQSAGRITDAYWAMRGFFTPSESRQLADFYLGRHDDFARNEWITGDAGNQPTVLDDVCFLEMSCYMRNQLLRDSDVMSMAWGLELRVPFVDRRLVDAIGRVPAEVRLAPGKRLLLDAVPEIPSWIAGRPKRGFTFPFERWIRTQWQDVFEQIRRNTPVPLNTWYRQWILFTLNHFLERNNFAGPPLIAARRLTTVGA